MSLDDELRHQLRSELEQLGGSRGRPAELLAALKPEMSHARRVRRIGQAGAVGLLVLGGIAIAQIGTGSDSDSVQIVPADQPTPRPGPTDGVVSAETEPVDADDAHRERARSDDGVPDGHGGSLAGSAEPQPEPAGPVSEDGERPDDEAAASETTVAAPTAPSSATTIAARTDVPPTMLDDGHSDDSGTADDGASADDVAPSTTAGDRDSSADDSTADDSAADDDSADDDSADDDPSDDASSGGEPATTTTAPPTTGPQRFESACGYIVADVSGAHPQIIEIVPDAGYRSVVEDEDHGSVTVHFEGGGEDCEVKVS